MRVPIHDIIDLEAFIFGGPERLCSEDTPSNAELAEMAKRNPPPQDWYDEDFTDMMPPELLEKRKKSEVNPCD